MAISWKEYADNVRSMDPDKYKSFSDQDVVRDALSTYPKDASSVDTSSMDTPTQPVSPAQSSDDSYGAPWVNADFADYITGKPNPDTETTLEKEPYQATPSNWGGAAIDAAQMVLPIALPEARGASFLGSVAKGAGLGMAANAPETLRDVYNGFTDPESPGWHRVIPTIIRDELPAAVLGGVTGGASYGALRPVRVSDATTNKILYNEIIPDLTKPIPGLEINTLGVSGDKVSDLVKTAATTSLGTDIGRAMGHGVAGTAVGLAVKPAAWLTGKVTDAVGAMTDKIPAPTRQAMSINASRFLGRMPYAYPSIISGWDLQGDINHNHK